MYHVREDKRSHLPVFPRYKAASKSQTHRKSSTLPLCKWYLLFFSFTARGTQSPRERADWIGRKTQILIKSFTTQPPPEEERETPRKRKRISKK